MACVRDHSDKLPSKRTRAQMQGDCVDSSIAEHEIEALKRSHAEGIAQPVSLARYQQRSLGSSSRVASESRSASSDIGTAGVLDPQEGESRVPLLKACLERDSGAEDSTGCGYLAPFSNSVCTSYPADGLAASACQVESLDKGILQSAESWCADDSQVDIACFLESWDDSIGDLLSAPLSLFEDNCFCNASLTGASDVLSMVDGVGEGEWCLNDVAVEAKRLWNEPSEQEWVAMAVASHERFSDDIEPQA